ncbi:MAG: phosphate acetyltransferase [Gammaproteobacteria bacterium]|nr:phosphate acetyltransferase [Gammaproteobacteria bacterium]
MTKIIMLAPASSEVGLTTIANGLNLNLKQAGKNSTIFNPIELGLDHIVEMLSHNRLDDLEEELYAAVQAKSAAQDYLIIDALSYSADKPFAERLNQAIARSVQAYVVPVISLSIENAYQLDNMLSMAKTIYQNRVIPGCIVNKYDLPTCGASCAGCAADPLATLKHHYIFDDLNLPLQACLPMVRGETVLDTILPSLNIDWLENLPEFTPALTPAAFRHRLSVKAKAGQKRIVLPEGEEPRTIKAAHICAERGLATPILLGTPEGINEIARNNAIQLSSKVEIIDPSQVREKYVAPMVEIRKNKGLTPEDALKQLEDNVVLGTMMVQLDEVDGLVSGAIHSTANTVRPALQLVKTKPDAKLVSSTFFMCLPEQVLAFADCAVNIKPNAEELADIAIQTAETAKQFGIEPRVAMISYSTGDSGHGEDVDKVKEATRIVKEKRPNLPVEGPIQYDAALVPEVAKTKLPNSKVAGHATVFVFPDLNTANPMAKGVQRSSNTITIGPLLQGLNKPANDLSRGCTAEDIVFTIALTAVQSMSKR